MSFADSAAMLEHCRAFLSRTAYSIRSLLFCSKNNQSFQIQNARFVCNVKHLRTRCKICLANLKLSRIRSFARVAAESAYPNTKQSRTEPLKFKTRDGWTNNPLKPSHIWLSLSMGAAVAQQVEQVVHLAKGQWFDPQ